MFFVIASPVIATTDLVALFERARQASGIKHEVLAVLMGITPEQLSQNLRGRGHLSLNRLLMLLVDPDGRQFLIALSQELLQIAGADDGDPVTYLRRALALMAKERLARLSATSEPARRTA